MSEEKHILKRTWYDIVGWYPQRYHHPYLKKEDLYLTIAFGERLMNLRFAPDAIYLCAGPGCALDSFDFSTLMVLPFLPLTFAHSMLPVLPIMNPHVVFEYR